MWIEIDQKLCKFIIFNFLSIIIGNDARFLRNGALR